MCVCACPGIPCKEAQARDDNRKKAKAAKDAIEGFFLAFSSDWDSKKPKMDAYLEETCGLLKRKAREMMAQATESMVEGAIFEHSKGDVKAIVDDLVQKIRTHAATITPSHSLL